MPTLLSRRKATQRRALEKQRKRIARRNVLNRAIQRARANIAKRRRLIRDASNPGAGAASWLEGQVGKVEVSSNDAPWLRAWEDSIPHNRLDWMIPGNPYCGMGAICAWWNGAHKLLPDDTVSTVQIANRARAGNGYRAVPFEQTRRGDLVVMHFGSGGPKHVGLARGPMQNGVFSTVEANTSPSNAGSQGNGGGNWLRSRPRGLVHTVARPK